MLTLVELIDTCPLYNWTYTHRHHISIELVTGQTLVMRSSLADLIGYKCTAQMLRNGTPWLQDKSDEVLNSIASLVDARFLQLANEQLKIANCVKEMLSSISMGLFYTVVKATIPSLGIMLLKYEPHATLAGWGTWLENCINYCKHHQTD